jgi:lactate permease
VSYLLSLAPIALILILMIGLRWGAARAGGAGYLLTLLLAVAFFGAGPQLLAYAHVKALLFTVDVLFIIWAAFLLYRVADEAGAIRTIGLALPHLTTDQSMQALLIGWVFASFLQGVGGFGVPVAVVAPILVGLGFTPMAAVVIPSIGHGWAVTFGSLGSSFQALMAATNLSDKLLAPPSALLLGIAGAAGGLMVAHAAGGWAAVRRLLVPVILLGAVMGIGQYLVATAGPWNIAAFIGSLAGLVICFPLAHHFRGEASQNNDKLDWRLLGIALSGYIILVAITLAVQLIPPVKEWLGRIVLQVKFPELSTSASSLFAPGYITPAGTGRKIVLFRHAGAVLTVSSILAYLIYRRARLYKPGAARRILGGTAKRVLSASVSIASMVTMATIMDHTRMTEILARGMADGFGKVFPLISPWIGALGAFMTGSNTNSNVVFGALQLRTAKLLTLTPAIILAAQTAGAGLASVVAPAKVVVGASTAGLTGHEGELMRKMFGYVALLVLLIGVLTLVAVYI